MVVLVNSYFQIPQELKRKNNNLNQEKSTDSSKEKRKENGGLTLVTHTFFFDRPMKGSVLLGTEQPACSAARSKLNVSEIEETRKALLVKTLDKEDIYMGSGEFTRA